MSFVYGALAFALIWFVIAAPVAIVVGKLLAAQSERDKAMAAERQMFIDRLIALTGTTPSMNVARIESAQNETSVREMLAQWRDSELDRAPETAIIPVGMGG